MEIMKVRNDGGLGQHGNDRGDGSDWILDRI